MSDPGAQANPTLARLEALIGSLEREARASERELADSDRERASAARDGRMGPEWQRVQRRIDAGETTVLDVFSGRDESPEAVRLRELSRTNLSRCARRCRRTSPRRSRTATRPSTGCARA